MIDLKERFQDFENMFVEIASNNVFVPLSKNKLKYKNFIIEKDRAGWKIEQMSNGYRKCIASTFLKISAFAVCKLYDQQKIHKIDSIIKQDLEFQKNYIDSLYYKNTYKKTKSAVLKDTAIWRYELSHNRAKKAKQSIDKEFYSLLR